MAAVLDDDPSSSEKKRNVPSAKEQNRHPGRVQLLQYRRQPAGLKAERNREFNVARWRPTAIKHTFQSSDFTTDISVTPGTTDA